MQLIRLGNLSEIPYSDTVDISNRRQCAIQASPACHIDRIPPPCPSVDLLPRPHVAFLAAQQAPMILEACMQSFLAGRYSGRGGGGRDLEDRCVAVSAMPGGIFGMLLCNVRCDTSHVAVCAHGPRFRSLSTMAPCLDISRVASRRQTCRCAQDNMDGTSYAGSIAYCSDVSIVTIEVVCA